MKRELPLNVKYGTIYTESGIGIDNMVVLFDKELGLIKYGDVIDAVDEFYTDRMARLKAAGLEDLVGNLILIKFERYSGVISIEDVCTFVNYMILCRCCTDKVITMLNMDEEDFKSEICKLKELGY